ncbi:putative immunoglobulin-blocking virulence protein [Mycoplasma zalophi]|uniref:Immunoglobulin-blocking virulence protein n=1 Tax=Mycoplasma zalophi TaxID=191287 RepID=A0ABS6DQ33_9MOLU|nr:putative immunoglobulin-blocking virulence protein [Mycoplasma zalophi]MBU4692286.1 putative immunoglobulin-blocking virulence protein [Mycoplasma zalophi]
MRFLKTKKQKILLVTISSIFAASMAASSAIYFTNKSHKQTLYYNAHNNAKNNFVEGNNVDLNNTVPSNSDSNLKKIPDPTPPPAPEIPPVVEKVPEPPKPEPEKPKPEEPKPEPIPEPKPEEPKPEPVPQPEPPKPDPIPEPPKPEPKPQPKPEEPKPELTDKAIVSGVEVSATIERAKPRNIATYDRDNQITNRVPYTNDSTDKLKSIVVTQELRDKVVKDVIGQGETLGLASKWYQDMTGMANQVLAQQPDKLDSWLNQNRDFWVRTFYKFERLFDSPNVSNFLKEDAKAKYPDMKFNSRDHRYIWLYTNLDWSKFTKLSSNAEKQLKEGYVLDPRNAYINADGSLDSHSYGQPDRFNSVTSRLTRDNSTRRVFSYDSYYTRSPDAIANGEYPGWKKRDANNDEIFNGLIQSGDGIKALHMQREKPTNEPGQINEGYVIEIDAANEAGYNKTIQLIKTLKTKKANVVSYRIKNMGKNSSAQAFKPILRELPDDILQLELFFSAQATNTSSLIELENKRIKELSLYTLGNSLQDEWSINPFSLRNTAWVNTNDYNVSADYGRNQDIATRITFNTLAFDQSDYLENDQDHWKRINLGLRMAYFARNNEPIFQGSLGPGLSPDHNEGNNSYPTLLDFSRIPKIKTLKGLEFRDIIKPSNRPRKVKQVTFYNNKPEFEISNYDLIGAGLENIDTGSPMEKPKILFSNGRTTTKFRIKDNYLSPEAISNLVTFKRYAHNGNSSFSGTVVLDPGNDALKSKLQSAGFDVEFDNGYEIS